MDQLLIEARPASPANSSIASCGGISEGDDFSGIETRQNFGKKIVSHPNLNQPPLKALLLLDVDITLLLFESLVIFGEDRSPAERLPPPRRTEPGF